MIYLIFSCVLVLTVSMGISTTITTPKNLSVNDLIDSDPINILGDSDLQRKAELFGWPGTGTQQDPITIANFVFNESSQDLLSIGLTSLHILITENLFCNGGIGVNLGRAVNIIVDGNDFEGNGEHCINVFNSSSIEVRNNNLTHNNHAYITIYQSERVLIENNFLVGDQSNTGISVSQSSDIGIKMNVIVNTTYGISIYASEGLKIDTNMVNKSLYHGVRISSILEPSNKLKLNNNTINESGQKGIRLNYCNNTSITYNRVSNSLSHGIELEKCSNTTVKVNDFISNNENDNVQGNCENSENCTFIANYWDNHVSPDDDADGVVDQKYQIDGDCNLTDLMPLVKSYTQYTNSEIEKILNPGDDQVGGFGMILVISSLCFVSYYLKNRKTLNS